jgi:hypothetical protein
MQNIFYTFLLLSRFLPAHMGRVCRVISSLADFISGLWALSLLYMAMP